MEITKSVPTGYVIANNPKTSAATYRKKLAKWWVCPFCLDLYFLVEIHLW